MLAGRLMEAARTTHRSSSEGLGLSGHARASEGKAAGADCETSGEVNAMPRAPMAAPANSEFCVPFSCIVSSRRCDPHFARQNHAPSGVSPQVQSGRYTRGICCNAKRLSIPLLSASDRRLPPLYFN